MSIDPYGPFATGFWQRQFSQQRTRSQLIFDMIFGVHAPVICFIADPIVFKSMLFPPALYPDFQIFVYLVTLLEVPLLAVWLLYGGKFKSAALLAGGALMAGALFSFLIGVVILPFSLIGLLYVIGIFGFIPFLTAFVYSRNAVRALQAQPKGLRFQWAFVLATIAAVYVIGLPAVVSLGTARVATVWTSEVLYGDEQDAESAAQRLRWLPIVPERSLNQLLWAYEREDNPDRRRLLAQRYREITGDDIERRSRIID
jgi:hypothetical protein